MGFEGKALCTIDVVSTLDLAHVALACLVIRLSRLMTRDVDAALDGDLTRAVTTVRVPHLNVGYVVRLNQVCEGARRHLLS